MRRLLVSIGVVAALAAAACWLALWYVQSHTAAGRDRTSARVFPYRLVSPGLREAPDQAAPADARDPSRPQQSSELPPLEQWWLPAYDEIAKANVRISTAKLLLAQGNYDAVISLMDEVIESAGGTDAAALALLLKGIALLSKGEREAAYEQFKTIIADYPNSIAVVEAVNRFGQYHFETDSVVAGMEWLIGILERDPTNKAAEKAKWELIVRAARRGELTYLNELWGVCLDGIRNGTSEIEAYEAGLALAKSLPRYNRPLMFELFKEIAEHCPDPTLAANAKLELLERYVLRYPDYALRLGQEILASEADPAIKKQARRHLLLAYAEQGDMSLVSETFDEVAVDGWTGGELSYFLSAAVRTALISNISSDLLSSWLDHVAVGGGEVGENALIWKTLLDDPLNAKAMAAAPYYVLRDLGDLFNSKDRYDLAERLGMQCLRNAEEQRPGDFGAYMSGVEVLTAALSGRGDYSAAAEVLRAALDKFPDAPEAPEWRVPLAYYFEKAGNLDAAIAEYQRVARDYPQSVAAPSALYSLAGAYEQKGDEAQARQAYQTIVEKYPDSGYAGYAKQRLEALSRTEPDQ